MLARSTKALFYSLAGPVMALNGKLRRRFPTRVVRTSRRAHLGPGQENYISGWINCDANIFTGKADLWVDLRHPLPFADATLDALYSHHVVEHLPNMAAHFREAARVLRSGGVYRIGGPDADMAIDRYRARNLDWFGVWPDRRRSLGGRLDNHLMCRGEHVALLTEDLLRELLEDAGFGEVRRVSPRHSESPDLFADVFPFEEEPSQYPYTVLLEATKA